MIYQMKNSKNWYIILNSNYNLNKINLKSIDVEI